jgi:hypothetical protein
VEDVEADACLGPDPLVLIGLVVFLLSLIRILVVCLALLSYSYLINKQILFDFVAHFGAHRFS